MSILTNIYGKISYTHWTEKALVARLAELWEERVCPQEPMGTYDSMGEYLFYLKEYKKKLAVWKEQKREVDLVSAAIAGRLPKGVWIKVGDWIVGWHPIKTLGLPYPCVHIHEEGESYPNYLKSDRYGCYDRFGKRSNDY